MPENQEIWKLFWLCSSQWRVSGLGSIVGLDYGVVFKVAEIINISIDETFMTKLKAIEAKAIEMLNKTRSEINA